MSADRQSLEGVARSLVSESAALTHLGTGGFACTFLVEEHGKRHALKVIDPNVADTSRVHRELAALQRVNHPGVVRFRDFGTIEHEGDTFEWITMDFVEGETLDAYLRNGGALSSADALRLIRKLVEGASAIWEQRTAHRDLSPKNIMCRPNGDPVIVDLGLARHVDDETLTALPTPGTPGWMSPEQVGSTPTHGDWRSDQFVIGSIAYLLLTRVRPYSGRSLMELWQAPALKTPRPVHSIDPSLPLTASEVVARMMALQPHRRYLKIEELLSDLDRAISELEALTEDEEGLSAWFFPIVGSVKSWATDGFIPQLQPDGVVLDARMPDYRAQELNDAATPVGALLIHDPVTWLSRSQQDHQPAEYKKLPYGDQQAITGFTTETARRAWCREVRTYQLSTNADALITPYFYAGEGELSWIRESLACARTYADLRTESEHEEQLWTTVLTHWNWIADNRSRDQLLTELTGQPMDVLHVLTHTNQASFSPLANVEVLRGFQDLFEVMRSADVPVIVGKRGSSGLLLIALGASGWTTGVSANLMNSGPHPESTPGRQGQATDRLYVPRLLNFITVPAYVTMRRHNPSLVDLGTTWGSQLLEDNPNLDSINSAERIMILRHNQAALRAQTAHLHGLSAGDRISRMREWVEDAQQAYKVLPRSSQDSDSGVFLDSWAAALS